MNITTLYSFFSWPTIQFYSHWSCLKTYYFVILVCIKILNIFNKNTYIYYLFEMMPVKHYWKYWHLLLFRIMRNIDTYWKYDFIFKIFIYTNIKIVLYFYTINLCQSHFLNFLKIQKTFYFQIFNKWIDGDNFWYSEYGKKWKKKY